MKYSKIRESTVLRYVKMLIFLAFFVFLPMHKWKQSEHENFISQDLPSLDLRWWNHDETAVDGSCNMSI